MALEVIRQQPSGRQSDIWSVGCTVIEMLSGRPMVGHALQLADRGHVPHRRRHEPSRAPAAISERRRSSFGRAAHRSEETPRRGLCGPRVPERRRRRVVPRPRGSHGGAARGRAAGAGAEQSRGRRPPRPARTDGLGENGAAQTRNGRASPPPSVEAARSDAWPSRVPDPAENAPGPAAGRPARGTLPGLPRRRTGPPWGGELPA